MSARHFERLADKDAYVSTCTWATSAPAPAGSGARRSGRSTSTNALGYDLRRAPGGDGRTFTYGYDPGGPPTTTTERAADGTTLSYDALIYDADGHVTVTSEQADTAYTPGATTSYAYDAKGRRTTSTLTIDGTPAARPAGGSAVRSTTRRRAGDELHRYYRTSDGRFISQDPSGLGPDADA